MLEINFKKSKPKSLIPVIIQEDKTGEVLMLGYMDGESLVKTRETGFVHFWSRSRKKLWKKGETSGNMLRVKKIFSDCDKDALLVKIGLIGKTVCHKGNKSCFFDSLK